MVLHRSRNVSSALVDKNISKIFGQSFSIMTEDDGDRSLHIYKYITYIFQVTIRFIQLISLRRRFVWNFFRLENEHLNNCGEFRAVRDISVAPLNADDQTLLEQMMDQDDGVRNRSGKKTWKRSYSLSLRRPLLSSSQ